MANNENQDVFCMMCGGKLVYNADEGVSVCSDCGFELVVDAPKDLEKVVESAPSGKKAKSTKSKSKKESF